MINPERYNPNLLRPIELSEWTRLCHEIESIIARSELLGINDMSCIVRDDAKIHDRQFSHQPDLEMFGASIGKLPIAEVLIATQCPPNMKLSWSAKDIDTTGGGQIDKKTSLQRLFKVGSSATAGELLKAMLQESANTPVRVFADMIGEGEFFNQVYADMGFEVTRVIPHENGRFYMWETTAQESLESFRRLALPRDAKDPMAKIAAEALWSSTVTESGIRQFVRPTGRLKIANKTGDYNGDNEPGDTHPIPYAVRHDIGIVKNGPHQLSYAFFTKTPMEGIAKKTAAEVVGIMGERVARTLGYRGGMVGSLAMRDVLGRPE